MTVSAANYYKSAVQALDDAEDILFGSDDHFVHLRGDLTHAEAERFKKHMQDQRKILEGYMSRAET